MNILPLNNENIVSDNKINFLGNEIIFEKIKWFNLKSNSNKNSIMIFPEGKRSNQKELLPFKKGAAYISKDFDLPIIPVVTHNAHNLMTKGEVWLRSGEIIIEIMDPINNTTDYTVEELTSNIYNLIEDKLKILKI